MQSIKDNATIAKFQYGLVNVAAGATLLAVGVGTGNPAAVYASGGCLLSGASLVADGFRKNHGDEGKYQIEAALERQTINHDNDD